MSTEDFYPQDIPEPRGRKMPEGFLLCEVKEAVKREDYGPKDKIGAMVTFVSREPDEYAGLEYTEYYVMGNDTEPKTISKEIFGSQSFEKMRKKFSAPLGNSFAEILGSLVGCVGVIGFYKKADKWVPESGPNAGTEIKTMKTNICSAPNDYFAVGEKEPFVDPEKQGNIVADAAPIAETPEPTTPVTPTVPVKPAAPVAETTTDPLIPCTKCGMQIPLSQFQAHFESCTGPKEEA